MATILEGCPSEVKGQLPMEMGYVDYDIKKQMKAALPIPRRVRKRLLASRRWIVSFVEDKDLKDPLIQANLGEAVVLRVDPHMEMDPNVMKVLTWAASQGRISGVLGHLDHRNPLSVAKQVWVYALAEAGGGGMMPWAFFPKSQEEEDWSQMPVGGEEYPWFEDVSEYYGWERVSFDAAMFGYHRPWKISTATNIESFYWMDGRTAPATPSPIHRWGSPLQLSRLRTAMAGGRSILKLSAADRAIWAHHLACDHMPYRRDCATCLMAAGVGRAHKRCHQPAPFSLAIDIAGPFRTYGRSMSQVDESQLRYLLVGAYRIPRNLLNPKGPIKEELQGMDPPDDGDDPLAEIEEGGGLLSEPGESALEQEDGTEEEAWAEPAPVKDPDLQEHGGGPRDELEEELERLYDEQLSPEERAAEKPDDGMEEPGKKEEEKDELEEKVKELTKGLDLVTLYMVRPLLRRQGTHVLQAMKEMRNQLRRANLPLLQLHTDRAREFRTRSFKSWIADTGIYHTKTSGSEPAANGSGEQAVRWTKRMTRQLLITSKAEARDWPMAARHAADVHWHRHVPPNGTKRETIPAFGQTVWFKAKSYAARQEKVVDAPLPDLPPRWKKGFYRGRAPDVSGGHVLVREDGGLVIAKGVRQKVIQPEEEEGLLPELEAHVPAEEGIAPLRRRVKKTPGELPKDYDIRLEALKTKIQRKVPNRDDMV